MYLQFTVDKKFKELVILIIENHSQLMQSLRKENINVETNSSTFHFEKQTSPQIRIDLSNMGGVAEDGVGFSGKKGEHQIIDDAGDVDVDGVGVSVNEGEQLVSDTPKVMFMIHWTLYFSILMYVVYHAHIVNAMYHEHFLFHFKFCHVSCTFK